MQVLAVPVYRYRAVTGVREVAAWVDVAECKVFGCGCVRALKTAQGGPRNRNRKIPS